MAGIAGWAGGEGATLRLRGVRPVDSLSGFGFGVVDEVDDFGMVDRWVNTCQRDRHLYKKVPVTFPFTSYCLLPAPFH